MTHPLTDRIAEVSAELAELEADPGRFGGSRRQAIRDLSIRLAALQEAALLVGFAAAEMPA